MTPLKISDYAGELDKRVLKALAHTQEMYLKHYQMSGNMGRLSSLPGFECWITEGRNSIGQVIWDNEWPMPFSFLYASFFLRVLRWSSPQSLIPHLEERFSGDIIDRDYIEGLLANFEEIGITQTGKIIIADDSTEPRPAGPAATLESLRANGGLSYAAYIEGGSMMAGRIATVRHWLSRKEEKDVTNEPVALPAAEEGSLVLINDISVYLKEKCSLHKCDEAAALAGLHVGHAPQSHTHLRVHAFTEALKETHSLRGVKGLIDDIRLAVAARYGIADYNTKYRPQHDKSTSLSGRNEKWDECRELPRKFLDSHYAQGRVKK
jgi:hypothetical protein